MVENRKDNSEEEVLITLKLCPQAAESAIEQLQDVIALWNKGLEAAALTFAAITIQGLQTDSATHFYENQTPGSAERTPRTIKYNGMPRSPKARAENLLASLEQAFSKKE